MEKIDIHLHLTLKQLPRTETMFISSAETMLPHLKQLGIGKGIIMSGGERNSPFSSNEECLAICKLMPHIYSWMCNLDDCNPDTIHERLNKYQSQGAVGVGEVVINRPLDDPFLSRLFLEAQSCSLPVLIHMSPQVNFQYGVVDEPGLPHLEQVLKTYPKLKLIGHSQPFWHEITKNPDNEPSARYSWGEGPVVPGGRLVELFEKYTNLYGDLSANSGGCAIMRDEKFGLAFLERFQDRLLFGTDMVNIEMQLPLGSWLDKQLSMGLLTKRAYEKICYKNATLLFHI